MNLLTDPVIKSLGFAAVASLGLTVVQTVRLASLKAEHATTLADIDRKANKAWAAREAEFQKQQAAFEAADQQHEKDKANAIATQNRTITDLRAGNLRLREQWRGCVSASSQAAGDQGGADAAAELRAKGASDLVRITADADAQVRALQAIIRASGP